MRVALANVERTWLKLADQCRRLDELIEIIESPGIAPAMEGVRPTMMWLMMAWLTRCPAADTDIHYDLATRPPRL